MKRNIAFVLVFFIIISLTGCGSSENKIIGKWYTEGKDFELSFAKDGTGSVSTEGITLDFSWSISDGVVTLTQAHPYSETRIPYEFEGSMLVLSSGGEQVSLKRK